MNNAKIIDGLHSALSIARGLGPLAGTLGIGGSIGGLITAAISVADNVMDRAKEGKIVLNSNDALEITNLAERLHEENKKLNDYIVNS